MGKIIDSYIDGLVSGMNLGGDRRAKAEAAFRDLLEKAAGAARQKGYSEERAETDAVIHMNRPFLFSRFLWKLPEYRWFLFDLACRLIASGVFLFFFARFLSYLEFFFTWPLALVPTIGILLSDFLHRKHSRLAVNDGLEVHRPFRGTIHIPFEKIEEIKFYEKDRINLPLLKALGIPAALTIHYEGKTVNISGGILALHPADIVLFALIPDTIAPDVRDFLNRIIERLLKIQVHYEIYYPRIFIGNILAIGLICLAVAGYCVTELWRCEATDMSLIAFAVMMIAALTGAFGFADRFRAGLCWLLSASLPILAWHGCLNMVAGDMLYFRWLAAALGGFVFSLLAIFTRRIERERLAVILCSIAGILSIYRFMTPPLWSGRLETWARLSKDHVPAPAVWAGAKNEWASTVIKFRDKTADDKIVEFLLVAGAERFYRVDLPGSSWDLLPVSTSATLTMGRWEQGHLRDAPAQIFHLTPPDTELKEERNPPEKFRIPRVRARESQPDIPWRYGKKVIAWKLSPDGKKVFVISESGITKRLHLSKTSIYDYGRKRWTDIEAYNLAQSLIILGLNAIQPFNMSWSPDSRNVCYGSLGFLLHSSGKIDSSFILRVARYEDWAEKKIKK